MHKKFSIFTAIFTFLALILGNLVVATNSGDACGSEWPYCNGKIIPDLLNYQTVIEYSHRLMTGLLGFVLIINIILLIKNRTKKDKLAITIPLVSGFLLVLQSLIGGANVILGTPPGFTTLDVVVSQLLLLTVTLIATRTSQKNTAIHHRKERLAYRRIFLWGFPLYLLQIVIGAFFKHSSASYLVFNIVAEEYLIQSQSLAQMIFFIHFILTVIILIHALWQFYYAQTFKVYRWLSSLYLALIILNGLSGVLVTVLNEKIITSSVHMIVSSMTVALAGIIIGNFKKYN